MKSIYITDKGTQYCGDSELILEITAFEKYYKKCNLIFTSPPFALNNKKKYGNLTGVEYKQWISSFSTIFKELLAPDGSIVIELGNAWNKGTPTMSTLPIESLLELKTAGDFYLCQEFIWHNYTKLPGPAQWVNVERIRVKDAFTRFWWLASNPKPKANNRNVLLDYSPSMIKLLERKTYNSGIRPSGHNIGKDSFLKKNKGAIPSNVLMAPNTISSDPYLNYCRQKEIEYHPARMPLNLADFFINFLTEPDDLIFDPFSGSNTTGYVAELNGRRWVAIDKQLNYSISSAARFDNPTFCEEIYSDYFNNPPQEWFKGR